MLGCDCWPNKYTLTVCFTLKLLRVFPAKTGKTFFNRGLWWRKLNNYATTQLHWPPLTENWKFLFHFTDFAVSIQTHFSIHLPDVRLRNPTHKSVRGPPLARSGEPGLQLGGENPGVHLGYQEGPQDGPYITCCVRKLMKTTCSGCSLMSVRCGAFVNKTEKNVLRARSPTGFHDGGVTTLLSESCFSVRPTLAFQGQVLHTLDTCVIKPTSRTRRQHSACIWLGRHLQP